MHDICYNNIPISMVSTSNCSRINKKGGNKMKIQHISRDGDYVRAELDDGTVAYSMIDSSGYAHVNGYNIRVMEVKK